MKLKKLLAAALVSVMLMSAFAGCGNSEDSPPAASSAGTESTSDSTSDTVDTSSSAEEETEDETEEETANIKVALMCFAPMDESQTAHVEEAINEMLLEKINVQADLMWFDAQSYATQVPMMIQAGEQLDLLMYTPVPGASYQSFMSQNQLMDITEYVDTYGADIKSELGSYLDATTKEGKIYGVTNNQPLYSSIAICMRKDILDELGLTEKAENMTSWEEYGEILEEVKNNYSISGIINSDAEGCIINPQPYMSGSGDFADAYMVDILGDSYQYVYMNEEGKVDCYFYNEQWLEGVKMVKDFYDKGYVYKDASTAQDYADTLIKNDVGFSMVKVIEDGGEAGIVAGTGYEVVVTEVASSIVTTGTFTKFGMSVPVTAKEPEAAVKFLNLLYSDNEVLDTLDWGVEGVDWELNADGMATYPEGVTADTVLYHTNDFLYGNKLISTPWEGDEPDVRERQRQGNELVESSEYLGFAVDSSVIANEITAVKNVVDQYKPQLSSGIVADVDASYAEFVAALEGAGIDKILETYQQQYDDWKATQ